MAMSGSSWFEVLIVWNEKTFTVVNVPDDMG